MSSRGEQYLCVQLMHSHAKSNSLVSYIVSTNHKCTKFWMMKAMKAEVKHCGSYYLSYYTNSLPLFQHCHFTKLTTKLQKQKKTNYYLRFICLTCAFSSSYFFFFNSFYSYLFTVQGPILNIRHLKLRNFALPISY